MSTSILQATALADFNEARSLFRAYGTYLAAGPAGAADIHIDGFEQEIASLPGPYSPPDGVILLAHSDGAVAGCVALRAARPNPRVAHLDRSCEMKRLWINNAYRGLGLGRSLVQAAIQWAQAAKYESMYLDTVPEAMPAAQAVYQSLGFERVARYNDNSVPGIVFFRLDLNAAVQLLDQNIQNASAGSEHRD